MFSTWGPIKVDRPTIIVAFSVLFFGIVMTVWSITKATVYDGYSSDLGNMWQSVWNLGHGHGWTFTHPLTGDQLPRLAIHADYLLLGYLPVTWWPEGWKIMLAVQAFGVGLAAWILYWLGRRIIGHTILATILALSYLSAGSVQMPTLWQYHSVVLVPTFLLAMAEAMLSRRRVWVAWLWFGLALVSEEQVGLIAGPLMAWLWLQQGYRRRALASVTIGWAWSFLQFGVIIPSQRPDALGSHLLLEEYFSFAGSNPVHWLTYALDPRWLFHRLWQPAHLANAIFLLLPFGGLALAHPLILLAVVAVVPFWLADLPTAHTLMHQHHVLTLPILALAASFGARFILQRLGPNRKRVSTWLATWLVLCGLLATSGYSVFPWTPIDLTAWRLTDPALATWSRVIERLPRTATVAYSPGLGPLARGFPVSYQLPTGAVRAEYLIFYRPRIRIVARTARTRLLSERSQELEKFVKTSPAFVRVASHPRGAIYRRIHPLSPAEETEFNRPVTR